jgi:hypothetical protein
VTEAELVADPYAWWSKAVRAIAENRRPPIAAGRVCAGYYRVRDGMHAPWEPLAIWPGDNGDLLATRGFGSAPVAVDVADLAVKWVFIARNPITYDDFEFAFKNGRFHNEIPEAQPTEQSAAGLGHNEPPADAIAAIKQQIAEATKAAEAWYAPFEKDGFPDQQTADLAATHRDKLNELHRKAEVHRRDEKKPFEALAEEVDKRWEVNKPAKTLADKLRVAMTTFGTKETARRAALAREELAAGKPIAEMTPVQPVVFQGAKKATKLRSKPVRKVKDYEVALAYLKDRPEVRAAVEKLVQDLDAVGHVVPGTEIENVAVAS